MIYQSVVQPGRSSDLESQDARSNRVALTIRIECPDRITLKKTSYQISSILINGVDEQWVFSGL